MNFRRIAAKVRPFTLFIIMVFSALVLFELFNFSTTEFALRDLLGSLNFLGVPWATILALAFCGIDLAGIARLLSPVQAKTESKETWYLFGAWLIAATMNTTLTWWGVSMAIANHTELSAALINQGKLLKVVPVFVAILVWVIRVLIIGSISYTFKRILGHEHREGHNVVAPMRATPASLNGSINHVSSRPVGFQSAILRPKSTMKYPAASPSNQDTSAH